ncbi:hypothetical protein [Novosphingobium sp.]|nr:hypothetical protein [Novosphingobium sp.]
MEPTMPAGMARFVARALGVCGVDAGFTGVKRYHVQRSIGRSIVR